MSLENQENIVTKSLTEVMEEAYKDLHTVLSQVEEVAFSLIDYVEKHLNRQEVRDEIHQSMELTLANAETIKKFDEELGKDLLDILSLLSFQDLTGQKLKKITRQLHAVEDSIADPNFVVSMKEEKLKGPGGGESQAAVDDLLAQLDM